MKNMTKFHEFGVNFDTTKIKNQVKIRPPEIAAA
jgi:hypothetical protein